MTQKNDHIVDAARAMFMRYGYSKTTMSDIAQEAGVARQTVYNAFPGKDEILREVVRRGGAETHAAIKSAWETSRTVEEKLEDFLRLGPVTWYETIQAAPDAAELIDGMHRSAEEEMERFSELWQSELTTMIETTVIDETQGPAKSGNLPLADVVEFFYAASINAKYGAKDVAHLKQRLEVLKVSTLALL